MFFQRIGEMFLLGLNGACVLAGFGFGLLAMLVVICFIGTVIGLLSGGDDDD